MNKKRTYSEQNIKNPEKPEYDRSHGIHHTTKVDVFNKLYQNKIEENNTREQLIDKITMFLISEDTDDRMKYIKANLKAKYINLSPSTIPIYSLSTLHSIENSIDDWAKPQDGDSDYIESQFEYNTPIPDPHDYSTSLADLGSSTSTNFLMGGDSSSAFNAPDDSNDLNLNNLPYPPDY